MTADRGMVTAEIAVALPALVLVTACAIWGVAAASVQMACTDAARAGARAAARGEPLASVHHLIRRSVPEGARVRVHRDARTSQVTIVAHLESPTDLPPLEIQAKATALTEPGAATPPPEDQP